MCALILKEWRVSVHVCEVKLKYFSLVLRYCSSIKVGIILALINIHSTHNRSLLKQKRRERISTCCTGRYVIWECSPASLTCNEIVYEIATWQILCSLEQTASYIVFHYHLIQLLYFHCICNCMATWRFLQSLHTLVMFSCASRMPTVLLYMTVT